MKAALTPMIRFAGRERLLLRWKIIDCEVLRFQENFCKIVYVQANKSVGQYVPFRLFHRFTRFRYVPYVAPLAGV